MQIGKRLLPILFYVLLIVFLVLYIKSIDFAKLTSINILWWFLLLGLVIDVIGRYWMVFIWLSILKGLGARNLTDIAGLAYVYSKSWLGRYIPGTAPWILGKIYFASKHGVEKGKLAISSLLEAALQIIVMLAFSLFALALDPRLDIIAPETKFMMITLLIACLIFLLPPVFNYFMNLAHRIIKKKPLNRQNYANARTIGRGAALYLVSAVFTGLTFFFITKSVDPGVEYTNLLFIMAIANLSGALGMLAIFVPSGLGVREGVQLLLLTIVVSPEHAIVIAVVARLLSVVSDLSFFSITKLASLRSTR